jgi:hypothetical protein
VNIEILYVPDCPHVDAADERLREALAMAGIEADIRRTAIDTDDAARSRGMRGSPTILIDGRDPFANGTTPASLSCRLFRTADGHQGAPTTGQLIAALTA